MLTSYEMKEMLVNVDFYFVMPLLGSAAACVAFHLSNLKKSGFFKPTIAEANGLVSAAKKEIWLVPVT